MSSLIKCVYTCTVAVFQQTQVLFFIDAQENVELLKPVRVSPSGVA